MLGGYKVSIAISEYTQKTCTLYQSHRVAWLLEQTKANLLAADLNEILYFQNWSSIRSLQNFGSNGYPTIVIAEQSEERISEQTSWQKVI